MTKHYIKRFDEWIKQKKKLDAHDTQVSLYTKEREVWWISIGVNVGAEIDGKNELFERPVLIFRKVGREQFYGLPLTSKEKSGPFYRLVHYGDSAGNVCLSQLRVFSTKRLIRKIDVVKEAEFLVLQETVGNFFKGERF
jgi:mRNA-degrading endonuclease toxin of MazEF toxin-antitoxin module